MIMDAGVFRLQPPTALRRESLPPLGQTATAMADSKEWAKAQSNRLEEQRSQELELRQLWWKAEEANKKEEWKKVKTEGEWKRGSWSWNDDQWATGWSWSSEQWGSTAEPTWSSEPTATSASSKAKESAAFPSRRPLEDMEN